MKNETHCPQCHSENIYADRNLWICPECSKEWMPLENQAVIIESIEDNQIKDCSGAVLNDGDTISILKELKIKGSTGSVKIGTKVKNIRLKTDGPDSHNISCKIDGMGTVYLKSEFVRKA